MKKDKLFNDLNENEKKLKRIVSFLNEKNIDLNNTDILEIIPEGYETIKYKAWGLRHANIEFEKGGKTFDDIDVKAITGLDSIEDALEIIGVNESDSLSEEWIIESALGLNEDLKQYINLLSDYLRNKFSLNNSEIVDIQNNEPEEKINDEMIKVRSIFGRS